MVKFPVDRLSRVSMTVMYRYGSYFGRVEELRVQQLEGQVRFDDALGRHLIHGVERRSDQFGLFFVGPDLWRRHHQRVPESPNESNTKIFIAFRFFFQFPINSKNADLFFKGVCAPWKSQSLTISHSISCVHVVPVPKKIRISP